MSSNVGLSTPRGSGTSGYVQRNHAFMKPRNVGAPYPAPTSDVAAGPGGGFRQRQPDRKILEHDRMREVEVRVMEERERLERLEERNEELEEEEKNKKKKDARGSGGGGGGGGKKGDADIEEGETGEDTKDDDRVLSDEEIEERCEALRAKLLRQLEDEQQEGSAPGPDRRKRRDRDLPPKERKQFKAYQVHELAEAKIQETDRLRRALGIREDSETGEISSSSKGPRFSGRE